MLKRLMSREPLTLGEVVAYTLLGALIAFALVGIVFPDSLR